MSRRAFTLVEVMLALAVLVALAASLMGFFWNLLEQRRAAELGSDRQRAAAAVIERIESDLLCGLAGAESAAGIRGTESSLVLLTRSVHMPRGQGSARVSGDLQGSEITYSSGAIRARRWVGASPSGSFETVSDSVGLLRFRYYDGSSWSAAFVSASKGGLPVAVEVALWFMAPEVGEQVAGELPTGAPPGEALLPDTEPDRVRLVIVPDGPVETWKDVR
jgi:prepilin-type N-terminal cleavage/methylation domain-containing protein